MIKRNELGKVSKETARVYFKVQGVFNTGLQAVERTTLL